MNTTQYVLYVMLIILPLFQKCVIYFNKLSFTKIVCAVVPYLALGLSGGLSRVCFGTNFEREHTLRHFLYSVSFILAALINVSWSPANEVSSYITSYIFLGSFSLLWFTLSHVLEQMNTNIRTHQGDIVVLPLTLTSSHILVTYIAKATDFVFLKSAIIVIPVLVGWHTLFYIGFFGFALDNITMFHKEGYLKVSCIAATVASVHITSIEFYGGHNYLFLSPVVISLIAQAFDINYDTQISFSEFISSIIAPAIGLVIFAIAQYLRDLEYLHLIACVLIYYITSAVYVLLHIVCLKNSIGYGAIVIVLTFVTTLLDDRYYPLRKTAALRILVHAVASICVVAYPHLAERLIKLCKKTVRV